MSRQNKIIVTMDKTFEFTSAIVLNDDELLVINGGQNVVTCGAGGGVGCGGGCGEGCMGCQKSEEPVTPIQPPVYPI